MSDGKGRRIREELGEVDGEEDQERIPELIIAVEVKKSMQS
jgi:hypothetical protein